MHYPNNALEKIEEVSYLIKNKDSIDLNKYLKTSDLRNHREVCDLMADYCKYMSDKFPRTKPKENEEDEEEAAEAGEPVNYVPDLLEEASTW